MCGNIFKTGFFLLYQTNMVRYKFFILNTKIVNILTSCSLYRYENNKILQQYRPIKALKSRFPELTSNIVI